MYQKIKEDLKQEYYMNTYPNDGQRFIAWYLRNIHGLTTYEAKDCITDGANDKQIDAVYIDNQSSTIYIIQGKFYSGDTVDSEPLREVLSSWVQIKDLQSLQESANDRLRIKIPEIATALDEDYEVCFELITTSALTQAAEKDLDKFKKELAENEQLSASLVLVDNDTLKYRYNEALTNNRPYIDCQIEIENEKCLEMTMSGHKIIIAAVPLKECIKIQGIADGSLFRKNVRQSLGKNTKVNKSIAKTLKESTSSFFFLHNGITAICSHIIIENGLLDIRNINVVNGCQSLSTILSCSESVRKSEDGYIMFRFYEISDAEMTDKISTSTNSQSTVTPRDLRSNDKAVLSIKRSYEQKYPDGILLTKRGEEGNLNTAKYNTDQMVKLTDLGKQLMAWHSQRPNNSYSETKIFDKYFDQLFHKDYAPENVQALNEMYSAVIKKWNGDNPIGFNEALLAMKAYTPYHHLYTISFLFCQINGMTGKVPNPHKVYEKIIAANMMEELVNMAGICLNTAFENAYQDAADNNKIFSPQNWAKTKASMKWIQEAVRSHWSAIQTVALDKYNSMKKSMTLSKEDFTERWSAD